MQYKRTHKYQLQEQNAYSLALFDVQLPMIGTYNRFRRFD